MSRQDLALILELTKRDFSERFAGSILGASWAIIYPLVNLSIYIIVFGQIMGARLPGTAGMYSYGIYVAVGLIPWACFANVVGRSTSIFLDRKHIISKVNTAMPAFIIYIALSESITFLISLAILGLFLAFTGQTFHSAMLYIPLLFAIQQTLAMGLGLLLASLTVFFRDVREITGVLLQIWFWGTPIVYLIDILPDIFKGLVRFNPLYIIIDSYHRIFVFNEHLAFSSLAALSLVALGLCGFSFLLFRYLEKDIRDFL
jgi:lipopolysaccharide transport system permease protein